jgi:cytosine/adenosine deaminase-related metal-dependent hydrolase/ubiquinone/menaquinone biosynthesis C-methylase UbiE
MGEPVYPAEKAEAREPVSALSQIESAAHCTEVFSAWAGVYDHQQNPLLMLEERYLLRLLPDLRDRDVLDVGCGTGRWLAQLSRLNPRSLHGIDPSPEMLAKAAAKNIPRMRLSASPCTDLPVEDASADVLLASFVLSYVDDLNSAARELARVARPGSDLFLSDMHPETATRLCWKRSFRLGEVELKLPANQWSIPGILDAFKAAGFVECAVLQPSFGAAEEDVFAAHGRLERFAEAEHLPAIYLLHLSKPHAAAAPLHDENAERSRHLLHGGQCALGPREKVAASIAVHDEQIDAVSSRCPMAMTSPALVVDLSDYLLLPGLINAHDHLEFALFPRLGRGCYRNAVLWAQDIQQNDAEIIATHRRISKRTRLWWGGIRNLLSGVTTVCHHNPLDPCLLAQDFPVRVVSSFGWEHSLPFAANVPAAHGNTSEDEPFIIHACEGIDAQSKEELSKLDELGVLDQRTVLVHGLALDVEGAGRLNTRGSSLIACPSSNDFLFGKTLTQEVLESVTRLGLGSDSPLTAAGDLLDEIRFSAHACALRPLQLYSIVTDSSASILRLKNGEGSMRPGVVADLVAVRDQNRDPADILCSLSASDIEFVMSAGRVMLASEAVFGRLPLEDRVELEPLSVDGNIRWLRGPVKDLLHEAERILGKGEVRLGGKLLCLPNS